MTGPHTEHALIRCMRQWCADHNRRYAYCHKRMGAAAVCIAAAFFLPDGPIHFALLYGGALTVFSIAVWRPPLRVELLPHHAAVPDDLLLAIAESDIDASTKAWLGSEIADRGYIVFETLFRAARVDRPSPGRDALARRANATNDASQVRQQASCLTNNRPSH